MLWCSKVSIREIQNCQTVNLSTEMCFFYSLLLFFYVSTNYKMADGRTDQEETIARRNFRKDNRTLRRFAKSLKCSLYVVCQYLHDFSSVNYEKRSIVWSSLTPQVHWHAVKLSFSGKCMATTIKEYHKLLIIVCHVEHILSAFKHLMCVKQGLQIT